ncbi:hypothetical protein Tco_1001332 [Tanacetum coccineum]
MTSSLSKQRRSCHGLRPRGLSSSEPSRPHALTNFTLPPSTSEEGSRKAMTSPKSVLRSVSAMTDESTAESTQNESMSDDVAVSGSFSGFHCFDTPPFEKSSDDLFDFPGLFDAGMDPGPGFAESDPMFIDPVGFGNWATDDCYFSDFGDVFGSDPLISL